MENSRQNEHSATQREKRGMGSVQRGGACEGIKRETRWTLVSHERGCKNAVEGNDTRLFRPFVSTFSSVTHGEGLVS